MIEEEGACELLRFFNEDIVFGVFLVIDMTFFVQINIQGHQVFANNNRV